MSSGSKHADVVPASSSPGGCTPIQKKQHSNGAKTTAAKTRTYRRLSMPDLPGYGGGVFCRNCMSINHQTQTCPLEDDDAE